MLPNQRIDQPDRERDEAVKALEAFAAGFAELSPEEIERETARALSEIAPSSGYPRKLSPARSTY